VKFAQRVQMALLPKELPKKLRGVDVAWHFDPATELGGDVFEFLAPEANTLVVAVGDVSGKGVPAALYGTFVGEVIRGRTFRRRFTPERGSPAAVLDSINRIMHERQLEEYYCTLCYAVFDLKRRNVTMSNSGLPFPIRATGDSIAQIDLPGLPLGSFGSSTYDEVTFDLNADDLFVFCSDGIFETWNAAGEEFGAEGIIKAVTENRDKPAKEIVSAIFGAMQAFRGVEEQTDDQTVVVVRITQ
jgi:sigma-B regulation protein RsbU (phosphoserine phosphatase)